MKTLAFTNTQIDDYVKIEIERIKESRNMRRINFSCVGEEHEEFIQELEEFVNNDD